MGNVNVGADFSFIGDLIERSRKNRALELQRQRKQEILGQQGQGGLLQGGFTQAQDGGLLANVPTMAANQENINKIAPDIQQLDGVETVYGGGAMTPIMQEDTTGYVEPAVYDKYAGGTGFYGDETQRRNSIAQMSLEDPQAANVMLNASKMASSGQGSLLDPNSPVPWKEAYIDQGDGNVVKGALGKGGRLLLPSANGFAVAPEGSTLVDVPKDQNAAQKGGFTNVIDRYDPQTKMYYQTGTNAEGQMAIVPDSYSPNKPLKYQDIGKPFNLASGVTVTQKNPDAPYNVLDVQNRQQEVPPQQELTGWAKKGSENSLKQAEPNDGKNIQNQRMIEWQESRNAGSQIQESSKKATSLLKDLSSIQQLYGGLAAGLAGKVVMGAGGLAQAAGVLSPEEEKQVAAWNTARAKEMKLMPLFKNDENGKNQYQGAMQAKEWDMLLASLGMLSATPEGRKYVVEFQKIAEENLNEYAQAAYDYERNGGGDMRQFDKLYRDSLDPADDKMKSLLAKINAEVNGGKGGKYTEPKADFEKRMYR